VTSPLALLFYTEEGQEVKRGRGPEMRINVELVDGRKGTFKTTMPRVICAAETRKLHRQLGLDPDQQPHGIVRAWGPDRHPVTFLPSYDREGFPTYVLPKAVYTCAVCGVQGERRNSMKAFCSDACRMKAQRAARRSRKAAEEANW